MKTDRYTQIILTVIAVCLVFNVLKELRIIPLAHADETPSTPGSDVNLIRVNQLKTNEDGSLNVRITAADVIRVEPAGSAVFTVTPRSSRFPVELPYSTDIKVSPSSNTTFPVKLSSDAEVKVKPAAYTTFPVELSSNAEVKVKPASYNTTFRTELQSNTEIKVKPAYGAVFQVKEVELSSLETPELISAPKAYPNPTNDILTIEYQGNSDLITICDLNGNIIEQRILDSDTNQLQLPVSSYRTGTYIYIIGNQSGKFIVK